MADYGSMKESAIANVISQKPLMMHHPGSMRFSELYDNPSNCETHLGETVNQSAQIRVTGNTKNFGSTANYLVSSSSLIGGMYLSLELTLLAEELVNEGWGWQAIDNISFTYPNSLIQKLTLTGHQLKDLSLLTCRDKKARNALMRLAGQNIPLTGTGSACIFIPSLTQWLSGYNKPLDMSILSGPIQIDITFNAKGKFIMYEAGGGWGATAAFNRADLVASTHMLLDSTFAIRNELMANPNMRYFQRALYYPYQTFNETIGATEATLNLTGFPSAMLNGLLISINNPSAYAADGNGTSYQYFNPVITSCSLEFGGQLLFKANSTQEFYANLFRGFGGDDLITWSDAVLDARPQAANLALATPTIGSPGGGTTARRLYNRPIFIPLCFDARGVLDQRVTENLPSYSGSSMQLKLTVSRYLPQKFGWIGPNGAPPQSSFNEDVSTQDLLGAANAACTIVVTYLSASAVEYSQGSVDLLL